MKSVHEKEGREFRKILIGADELTIHVATQVYDIHLFQNLCQQLGGIFAHLCFLSTSYRAGRSTPHQRHHGKYQKDVFHAHTLCHPLRLGNLLRCG